MYGNMLTKIFSFITALFIAVLILFSSCTKEEPEIYQFNIIPVKINYRDEVTTTKTETFAKDKIGFKLDSYKQKSNLYYIEELDILNCSLHCDKDIMYNSTNIDAGKNLLEQLVPIISLERYVVNQEFSNEDYYFIKIRGTNQNKFTMPTGEYTFYFEGRTVSGRLVKDDVIIKYYEQ